VLNVRTITERRDGKDAEHGCHGPIWSTTSAFDSLACIMIRLCDKYQDSISGESKRLFLFSVASRQDLGCMKSPMN
jgi:hypothetical protein